jgi:cytochrome b561
MKIPVHYSFITQRYGVVAMVFHWVLALMLVMMCAVGLYMTDLPFSPQRLQLYNWHKWAGVIFLTLSLARWLWRLTHRPPALPDRVTRCMPAWQRVAYHATHRLMYLLFLMVPLVGWAYSSAAGFPVVLFGVLPLPDFVPVDRALAEWIKPWHERTAWALMALVALHVAAVLKHQLINKDGILQRMFPKW